MEERERLLLGVPDVAEDYACGDKRTRIRECKGQLLMSAECFKQHSYGQCQDSLVLDPNFGPASKPTMSVMTVNVAKV